MLFGGNSPNPILRVENLTKIFDTGSQKPVTALDNVNLSVCGSDFLVVVGPSGCGKSTLLRIIAGLESESSGQLYMNGKFINNLPPEERNMAWIPQNVSGTFIESRSVISNLLIGPLVRQERMYNVKQEIFRFAELLRIENLLERYPSEFSGGEKQRVALLRSFLRKPDLFLFDEPLTSLDEPTRESMRNEFRNIHRNLGGTFLYVTHGQNEALSLASKCAVMDSGRILQVGSPKDIYYNPVSIDVAAMFSPHGLNKFVSSCAINMNEVRIESEEFSVTFSRRIFQENLPSTINIAIRADDLYARFEENKSINDMSLGTYKVKFVDFAGPHTFLTVKNHKSEKLFTCIAPLEKISYEDEVEIFVKSNYVMFFDSETGKSLKNINK